MSLHCSTNTVEVNHVQNEKLISSVLVWGTGKQCLRTFLDGCCSTSGVSPHVCGCARSPVLRLAIFFRHAPTPLWSHIQKLSATSGRGSVLKHRSCQKHLQNARTIFFSSEYSQKVSISKLWLETCISSSVFSWTFSNWSEISTQFKRRHMLYDHALTTCDCFKSHNFEHLISL